MHCADDQRRRWHGQAGGGDDQLSRQVLFSPTSSISTLSTAIATTLSAMPKISSDSMRGSASMLPRCARADLLVVTADHGNDPSTPSTDHSREYVPILLTGARVRAGVDIGTRGTFADLGQTLAENFGVEPLAHGTSFLGQILEDDDVEHP